MFGFIGGLFLGGMAGFLLCALVSANDENDGDTE